MQNMRDSTTASSPSEGTPEAPAGPQHSLVIDEARREAFWRGQRLDLSPAEFAVLACLARQPGQAVAYDTLLREAWGTPLDQGGSLAQVQSTVKRLRQKLPEAAGRSCRLVNVRGVGYRLDFPSADESALPGPRRRSHALALGLALIAVTILATAAAAWLLIRGGRGDPTTIVWYRERRVPAGVLWVLQRGQHCCVAPDGELYCFDTPEERAAALDLMLGEAAPQEQLQDK